MMNHIKRGLAIYTVAALTCLSIYSIYYAVVGDNAPFWIIIVAICVPVIAFALMYLMKK